jgi:hypothetical protein
VFDTFTGLPTHILVSHFAVAFIPIIAAATVGVALYKPLREKFAPLMVLVNVAGLALAFVTMRAGEDLMDRYRKLGDDQTPRFDHEDLGRTLVWIMAATTVAAMLVWAVQPIRDTAPPLVWVLSLAVAALAVTTLFFSYRAGHTGSESHWKDFVENSGQAEEQPAPTQ